MEEDLGKEGIELKPKKPRSEAQVKAFEKAREIRLENSKIKKEKIAQVKEEVKNRNKDLKVSPTTPSLSKEEPKPEPVKDDTPKIKKQLVEKKIIQEESEDEVVVVKKKKKPKVIYVEESDEEPEPVIVKKKKEVVIESVLAKPNIRFF
jgi:hypothetical protein